MVPNCVKHHMLRYYWSKLFSISAYAYVSVAKNFTNGGEHDRRRHSSLFIVNFEHMLHIVLVFLLSTYNKYMPSGDPL